MEKDCLPDKDEGMSRRKFLTMMGAAGVTLAGYTLAAKAAPGGQGNTLKEVTPGENVFAYMHRV